MPREIVALALALGLGAFVLVALPFALRDLYRNRRRWGP